MQNEHPVFLNKSKTISADYFQQHEDILKEDTVKCSNLLTNFINAEK